jgi:hypothetical protein
MKDYEADASLLRTREATMLRDNLVGLIEPMLSSAGANPFALCTAGKKSSDDTLRVPDKLLWVAARRFWSAWKQSFTVVSLQPTMPRPSTTRR